MKEELLNKITLEEYQMIDWYRDNYMWNNYDCIHDDIKPSREILGRWASAKQDLYTLFGNNLILSKEIEYIKDTYELKEEMDTATHYCFRDTKLTHTGKEFYDNYFQWRDKYFPCLYYSDAKTEEERDKVYERNTIRTNLADLMDSECLVKNCYDGDCFTISLNGKEYKVSKGAKVMRVLSKIAAAYNLDGFEEFRLAHSLVLNQKKMKGILTLSIHPLDYMTMSDNDCDWDSCMSWQGEGSYRQGTVEMMNSPMVVMAYLNAAEPMPIGDSEWSNKKWRQLFIVNPLTIASIKAYPYQSDVLAHSIMDWLKSLAEKNWGTNYTSESPVLYAGSFKENLIFETNTMYNDMNCEPEHYLYLSKELENYKKEKTMVINYSGESQCMACGNTFAEFSSEQSLVCEKCDDMKKCADCGCFLTEEEIYTFGNETYCENCYCDHVGVCDECDSDVARDDLYAINIFVRKGESYDYCSVERLICKDCLEDWLKANTYPNATIYRDRSGANEIYLMLIDCKDTAVRYWKNYNYSSIEEYIERNRFWSQLNLKDLNSYELEDTAGSLTPTFVTARPVSLAVRLAYAFTL